MARMPLQIRRRLEFGMTLGAHPVGVVAEKQDVGFDMASS